MVSSENTGGVSNNKNGGTGASSSSSWSVIKFLDDNVRYIKVRIKNVLPCHPPPPPLK